MAFHTPQKPSVQTLCSGSLSVGNRASFQADLALDNSRPHRHQPVQLTFQGELRLHRANATEDGEFIFSNTGSFSSRC